MAIVVKIIAYAIVGKWLFLQLLARVQYGVHERWISFVISREIKKVYKRNLNTTIIKYEHEEIHNYDPEPEPYFKDGLDMSRPRTIVYRGRKENKMVYSEDAELYYQNGWTDSPDKKGGIVAPKRITRSGTASY